MINSSHWTKLLSAGRQKNPMAPYPYHTYSLGWAPMPAVVFPLGAVFTHLVGAASHGSSGAHSVLSPYLLLSDFTSANHTSARFAHEIRFAASHHQLLS
ncbi:hypothetical protein E2C01_048796 [Portunus trituberculatus]|uniref:Uncharacterized protein n=1 Tax=Portunus trituberculatus TaxID=210409 RepID=A0A5B7GC55_PORTR|nr:hypothetical protein [Portunus trituberculatus]